MGDLFATLEDSQSSISIQLPLSNTQDSSIIESEGQQRQEQYRPMSNSETDESEIQRFQNFGVTLMEVLSIASHYPSADQESDSLAILAAEEEQDSPPPSTSELILRSRWPLTRKRHQLLLLTVVTALITCMCIFYAYNASISSEPLVHLLWNSSDTTIFTVNVFTQLSIVFLTELIMQVCENLRWSRVSNLDKGFPFLSFLALGRSTSMSGLYSLATSFPNLFRLRLFTHLDKLSNLDMSYQSLAIQR